MTREVRRACSFGVLFSCTLFAQPGGGSPRFEVADIHRSGSAMNPQTYRSGGFLRGERYDVRKATMLDLIRLAYGIEPDKVFGGPDWLAMTRFDIAAKAPASSSSQEVSGMLQSLLVERFGLTFHKDLRPLPVYALRVGAGSENERGPGRGRPRMQVSGAAQYLHVHGLRMPKRDDGWFRATASRDGGRLFSRSGG